MSSKNTNSLSSPPGEITQNEYEILGEECQNYDLSFKIIIIGNSGNYYIYI